MGLVDLPLGYDEFYDIYPYSQAASKGTLTIYFSS
jgi:hypothetical protein